MRTILFILLSSISALAASQSIPYPYWLPMSNNNMVATPEPIPPMTLPAKFTLNQSLGGNGGQPCDVLAVSDGVANSPHGAGKKAPPVPTTFDDFLPSAVNFQAAIVFVPTPSDLYPPVVSSASATITFQTSGNPYYDFISGTSGGSLSAVTTDAAGGAVNNDAVGGQNPGFPSSQDLSTASKTVPVVQPVTDPAWSEMSITYNGITTTLYFLYSQPTPNSPVISGSFSGFTSVDGSDCGASATTIAILTQATVK